MKNRFRIPALLLALFLCLNLLPFRAFASEFEGFPDEPAYKVILAPGAGSGEELEFPLYDPALVTADREHAGNCQFYAEEGVIGFKLGGSSCPFGAPSGYVFSGWSPDPACTPVGKETTFTAQWTPDPDLVKTAETKAAYTVTVTNGEGGGEYAEGESVSITANTPEGGKRFKEWTGAAGLTFTAGSATAASATFTMPAAAVELTATYEDIPASKTDPDPVEYEVTVSVEGQGNATVNPGKGVQGATVSLSATPSDGNQFKEWTVTPNNGTIADPTSANTTFTIGTADVAIKAVFETVQSGSGDPVEYEVTVSVEGQGIAEVNPGKGVQGATVSLSATPSDGNQFKEWTVTPNNGTIADPTSANTTFTIGTADVAIKAVFEAASEDPDPTTFNITLTKQGQGSVTADPTSGAEGTVVSLSATPAAGYAFKEWTVTPNNGTIADTTSANTTFTIGTAAVEIKAVFEAITYNVTVSNDGNGTASADPTSGTKDTPVTITAVPKEDYRFKEWQVISGGVTLAGATTATTTFTIGTADVEVKAIFEEIPYVVTVNAATHGTVTADPTSAPKGATVTLTITPEAGYELDSIDVKDPAGNTVAVSNNTFLMPRCNVTVSATFKAAVPVSYKITTGANGAWIKGSGLTYTLAAKRNISDSETASHFTGVMIDKTILPITDYTIKAGSIIVTIKASAMQKLAMGYHTFTLYFDDGIAATRVYIWGNPGYPSTGDERDTAAWAVLAGVTLIGMGAIAVLGCMYWKKQKNKGKE